MSTQFEPYDFTKIRLFVAEDLGLGRTITLDRDQAHYLVNVMRMGEGEGLLIFNGREGEWAARIVKAGKKSLDLLVEAEMRKQDQVPDLELLFAPVKRARLDFLVQKACELGVSSIRPVMTRRTNVARVKDTRLEANVIEAAEQCGRMTVPEVKPVIDLSKLLDEWPSERRIIFCDEARDAKPMAEALKGESADGGWSILIGPEGGFDDNERQRLLDHPACLPVSLGPRIMRADTAALAALTIWQSVLGDLG